MQSSCVAKEQVDAQLVYHYMIRSILALDLNCFEQVAIYVNMRSSFSLPVSNSPNHLMPNPAVFYKIFIYLLHF